MRRLFALALAPLLSLWTGAAADERQQPVPEPVPPGTEGVLRTVIDGNAIEQIPVEFIGVLRGALGPGHDVHLVELKGEIAERVGVAFGMSGSPVFVGDRLVGALAYRYGLIAKRPIGGVVPLEYMLEGSRDASAIPAGEVSGPTPIATPISLAGLATPVADWLVPQLEALGFVPVAAGAQGSSPEASLHLEPGSPIGVELVGGDLRIAATGTVTWVDGEAVYAWGHGFLNGGRVELPMIAVDVVHTLSDMTGSFRMTNLGAEVGAATEDRYTALVGRTGVRARRINAEVRLRGGSYDGDAVRFHVAHHPRLTPQLVGASVANAVIRNLGFDDALTMRASGTIRLRDLPELPVEMTFSGAGAANPALAAGRRMTLILQALYDNRFAEPHVETIDLDFDIALDRLDYTVESLLYDRGPVSPGETRTVQCVLRGYRGEEIRRTFELAIPEAALAGSTLKLAVGSPDYVDQATGRTLAKRLGAARDPAALVRALGELAAADRLTAALYRPAEGVVSAGEHYADLPGTAARLLASQSESGSRNRTDEVSLLLLEQRLDGPVVGGLTAELEVRDGAQVE